jgi:hypothetical protein
MSRLLQNPHIVCGDENLLDSIYSIQLSKKNSSTIVSLSLLSVDEIIGSKSGGQGENKTRRRDA